MSQNAGDAGVPIPPKRKAADDADPNRQVKRPKTIVVDLTAADDSDDSQATQDFDFGDVEVPIDTADGDGEEPEVVVFDLDEIDPADSVLPDGLAAPLAAYVRRRAARIIASIVTLPPGDGRAATHFARLRQRYLDHPREDRPLGGTAVAPAKTMTELPIVAGERTANAIADEYALVDLGNTWSGWWTPTGRASVPAPMVGRRDLQLLSQLSQLLINDQHAAEYERVARDKAAAKARKAKEAAAKKAKKARGSAGEEMEVKTSAIKIKKAQLTQEVEAMVLGDRILISANEQWAVDHLCSVDLQALLWAKQTPGGVGEVATWKQRKERKIADLAAALAVEEEAAEDPAGLSAAAIAGLARLVQLEVDCQLEPGQSDAVKAILAILHSVATGVQTLVHGGEPVHAAPLVNSAHHAGRIIVVDACVDNKGKALTHAEQNILLTALLANYAGASSVAGGKRPCTVCWLTLRLTRTCNHDVNFNWHPGGFWRGSTYRGLVQVAQALGINDEERLRRLLLEICAEPGSGLIQYVTQLATGQDQDVKFEQVDDLPGAVQGNTHRTDVATQSMSESYHDLGSFSSQEGSQAEHGGDEDEFSRLWREDVSEDEFEGAEAAVEIEGDGDDGEGAYEYEDEGEGAGTRSGVAVRLELLPGWTIAGSDEIEKEVIGLSQGTSSFGGAGNADVLLPGAPATCFTAAPADDGVQVRLLDSTVHVLSAELKRIATGAGTATVVRFGEYITAGPYLLSFIKLDLD